MEQGKSPSRILTGKGTAVSSQEEYQNDSKFLQTLWNVHPFTNPLRGVFPCDLTEGANSSYVTACCYGTRTWFYKTSINNLLSMRLMLKELLSKRVLPKTSICVSTCSMINVSNSSSFAWHCMAILFCFTWSHRIRCLGGRPRAHGGLGHSELVMIGA